MRDKKFTEGPWVITSDHDHIEDGFPVNTKRLASGTIGSNSHVSYLYQTKDADSALISAAPELLEALEAMRDFLFNCEAFDRISATDAADALRVDELQAKAIGKAYGES